MTDPAEVQRQLDEIVSLGAIDRMLDMEIEITALPVEDDDTPEG